MELASSRLLGSYLLQRTLDDHSGDGLEEFERIWSRVEA
jgi:hypothetical protein